MQVRHQLGFIPNMYANMVNAPGVLSTYLHALYIILAAGVKTLSNFTNHALGTPLDARFESYSLG